MKCPYCGETMGEFNLATPPLGGRASIEVFLCRDCQKIMIDY